MARVRVWAGCPVELERTPFHSGRHLLRVSFVEHREPLLRRNLTAVTAEDKRCQKPRAGVQGVEAPINAWKNIADPANHIL